jgi:hypothetical protein
LNLQFFNFLLFGRQLVAKFPSSFAQTLLDQGKYASVFFEPKLALQKHGHQVKTKKFGRQHFAPPPL